MWAAARGGRWDQFAELCPSRQSGQSWHSTEGRGSWWNQPVEFHSSWQFWLTLGGLYGARKMLLCPCPRREWNNIITKNIYREMGPKFLLKSLWDPSTNQTFRYKYCWHTYPHESSRSNHNFRQNLQHFQATRHFQESDDSCQTVQQSVSAFYLIIIKLTFYETFN